MLSLCVGPLVRAVNATNAVIWTEFSQHCTITISCRPLTPTASPSEQPAITATTSTINVGGHFYAAPMLQGLQPATWYSYQIAVAPTETDTAKLCRATTLQYFRTAGLPASSTSSTPLASSSLRIAYGSCRKANLPAQDALSALGQWLEQHFDERESLWPQLLLLIGDQIYADQPPEEFLTTHPQLREGAKSFADFCLLYNYAWTQDAGVRQALATLPTYMILDDHEIINNLNTLPTSRAEMLQAGMAPLLIDGLVAYWVYQAWGNIMPQATTPNPLLRIMQTYAANGEDALPALRACVEADLDGQVMLPWHYTIETEPPIFVTNARTERTNVALTETAARYAPSSIMSPEQMQVLQNWLQAHTNTPTVIVSSVPVLLPPVIGLLEYIMGMRPLSQTHSVPLRWLAHNLAKLQLRIAGKMSFDHWPLYATSWHKLTTLLTQQPHSTFILSGDVHFSYTAMASKDQHKGAIYQCVSTPFENSLDQASRKKVRLQAHLSQLSYGGVHTSILAQTSTHTTTDNYKNLLFQNTIALLTFQMADKQSYKVEHSYLGPVGATLATLATTRLPTQS